MRSPQALARRQARRPSGRRGCRGGAPPCPGVDPGHPYRSWYVDQGDGPAHGRHPVESQSARARRSRRLDPPRDAPRAAEALGCELHYVFVPAAPLEDAVRQQARAKAQTLVGAATHTMRLEDQEPEASVVAAQSTRSQTTSLTHQVCGPPPDERTVSDPLLAVGDGHTPLDPDDRLGLKPA